MTNGRLSGCGLGDQDGQAVINVAANSQSSSFLPMLAAHSEAAPESMYVGEQSAEIRRLDGMFHILQARHPVFLKIDTQGFEKKVLQGAEKIMGQIGLVQVECSFVPLYEGAILIEEIIAFLRGAGFDPIERAAAFHHRDSAHLMQADIFARAPLSRRQSQPLGAVAARRDSLPPGLVVQIPAHSGQTVSKLFARAQPIADLGGIYGVAQVMTQAGR